MQRIFFLSIIALVLAAVSPSPVDAGLIDDIRSKINERASQIDELEEEIQQYQEQLEETQKEAQTLENTIKTLDIQNKRISTDINVTQNQIASTNLTIQELEIEIDDKERRIDQNRSALAEALRELDRNENQTIIEVLLNNVNLADFWGEIGTLQQFQKAVRSDVDLLLAVRSQLAATVAEREGRKAELEEYQSELSDQRRLVQINKEEKDELLDDTKNREEAFQAILEEKLRQREEFERELRDFEAELQVAIDPDSLPEANTIFNWPVEKRPIRITQLFGNTHFARQNPQVYGGRNHGGVDFGVPTGTAIPAPLSGTVWKVGNTDSVRGCYSWGKWILIKHRNGLSTLYAHLSLTRVNEGDNVVTGDIIGYSGNTGFSTGPHLHFGLYATKGVRIVPFESIRSTTRCAGLVTPAAAANAYLDPMSYLPQNYELHL